ncbi:hypothetical protein MCOR25_003639 [Pyricularia grisea]|uniref:DUF7071 domain-containing protein n=1 Tax=Pyricularia grisea TaxID=148305 RepID=A0A6P8B238_PYRGI|nr:uncharacterized protein PgNI_07490 [Pyricularia grisea]KAI6372673.1 hypothetical protein MCOR25_003639 [Pyricularia grisea]TLD08970.1 hypothetical protein PgNI_07490 [Pyricularia grisea]
MATLENNNETTQLNGSGSPLHQQNENNDENVDSPTNGAKRQVDEESSQDGSATKRVRTGDADDQPFLVNEDFEVEEISPPVFYHMGNPFNHSNTEQSKAQSNSPIEAILEVEDNDDDVIEVVPEDGVLGSFSSSVKTIKPEFKPAQSKNNTAKEVTGDDDDVVIIDSPVASHMAPNVHKQTVESKHPVQDVAASNQETLNYAMAKDALGVLADCTAIRFVLSHAPNVVNPNSWEKARDILTKVPPARDDYDIFKRLLFTWYTDRSDPTKEAVAESPAEEVVEDEEEPEPEQPEEDLADKVFEPYVAMIKQLYEQVEKSKSEMREDKKFAAVNEDTQFLKKLADKLQDLWVRLLSSTDEKTLKFSRRVIAEELQEEIDQVLDHLDYKKQRDADAEAEAAAEAEATAAAAIAETANGPRVGFSEPATSKADIEISLTNVDWEKNQKDDADFDGAVGDDANGQNQGSPTDENTTSPRSVHEIDTPHSS